MYRFGETKIRKKGGKENNFIELNFLLQIKDNLSIFCRKKNTVYMSVLNLGF